MALTEINIYKIFRYLDRIRCCCLTGGNVDREASAEDKSGVTQGHHIYEIIVLQCLNENNTGPGEIKRRIKRITIITAWYGIILSV